MAWRRWVRPTSSLSDVIIIINKYKICHHIIFFGEYEMLIECNFYFNFLG